MKTLLKKTFLIGSACLAFAEVNAQEKIEKASETFQVGDNVDIEVDAKYTELTFETWNQDKVKIEAYIEGKSEDFETKGEKEQILDAWDLKIIGNSNKIEIVSNGNGMNLPQFAGLGYMFDENRFEFLEEHMEDMIAPLVEQITVMPPPQLPESLLENIGEIEFDYEAYKENGEKYLKQFQKQMDQHFGKDFQASMQQWGEEFAKRMKERSALIEKRAEKMEERSGQISKRAEQMEDVQAKISERAEELAERMQKMTQNDSLARFSKKVITDENGNKSVIMSFQDYDVRDYPKNIKRVIKIKMPKGADLNLNVRHGKVNLEEETKNLTAHLSHTPFKASNIGGENTMIQTSYAPVDISEWEKGKLSLSYVTHANIGTAKSIKLSSNSSNVQIGKIEETGIISGTFGDLSVNEVGNGFSTLAISLKNSNFYLQLPNTAFDFSFNGSHSEIEFPSSLNVDSQESYGQKFINGYYKSNSNEGRISINAQFSDVVLEE